MNALETALRCVDVCGDPRTHSKQAAETKHTAKKKDMSPCRAPMHSRAKDLEVIWQVLPQIVGGNVASDRASAPAASVPTFDHPRGKARHVSQRNARGLL